jgi:hypothetical protein
MSTFSLKSEQPGPAGAAGSVGAPGAAGVGAQALARPADNGLLAWSCDPAITNGNVSISAGIIYLMRAKMDTTSVITKVGLNLRSTAPAGLANAFVGVYTASGSTATRIGQSAEASATLNGQSNPTFVGLSAATSELASGTTVLLAFLVGSGSTLPTLLGLGSSGRPNAFNSSKPTYRSLVFGTGQTALPATIDLSSASAGDGGTTPCFVAA